MRFPLSLGLDAAIILFAYISLHDYEPASFAHGALCCIHVIVMNTIRMKRIFSMLVHAVGRKLLTKR